MSALFIVLVVGLFVVLFWQVALLREKLRELSGRIARLEGNHQDSSRHVLEERKLVPPEPAAAERKPVPPPIPASLKTPPPVSPATPPPVPASTAAPVPAFNWEAFMGVKLFAWLGGLALFLGVVFLVKYSFENNLITPFGRLAIGGAVGVILIGLGWWLARGRYRIPAQSLCATGIVILYADLFAAHSFYELVSLTTAFLGMTAVTLLSFILAVALEAQVVVILGLLGGFLTPVLLRSGVDNAPVLFLYVTLLDLGVAAVALRKRWLYLLFLAALGTVLMQLGWAGQFFSATKGGRAFWIFLGFEALFVSFYFIAQSLGERNEVESIPAAAAGTSGRNAAPQSRGEAGLSSSSLRREMLPHVRGATSSNAWLIAAACVAALTALGFGFWICAVPLLGRQPLYFFTFIFLADAGLLALPVLGRAHRSIAVGAGAIAFALVALWIGLFAAKAPMSASLAAIVIFAILHAATTPASAWRPGILPFTATGTLTPFLLLIILMERLRLSDPTPIFAVAFVLSAILLGAAIVRRADWLSASALFGVALLEWAWQEDRFVNERVGPALVWYGLFLALFVAYPFCSAQKEKVWAWAVSALAQALQFWFCYRAITLALPNDRMGLLALAFVLPAAVGVWALLGRYQAIPATGDARLAWQGGVLLLFVSLIFPLQFHREWITLGWALEGVALLWLFRRVPHWGLRLVAIILLCGAFVRLALNPAVFEYHKRTGARIWNWYLYAYGITTACLFAGTWLVKPRPAGVNAPGYTGPAAGVGVPGYNWLLGSLGVILAFLLLNLEIADYFSIGPTLTFSFTGNFARDMTYSIAWALFALVLIVAGMRIKLRAARYAGVALLVVTLGKLFLHDLSDLSELYRIGAFVGVAIILIAASFIYQRFLAQKPTAG